MKRTHLMMIDPQNDFCNKGNTALADALRKANIPSTEWPADANPGALFVPGANEDMARLAKFITKNQTRLTEVHCTLDSHQVMHIAHPPFWRNSKGEMPKPFTLITADDVRNGVWTPYNPLIEVEVNGRKQKLQEVVQTYVDTLAKNARYVLCIWPIHCLIGSWGHSIVPAVSDALVAWQSMKRKTVNFVAKGSNPLTEHYSGVQADVPYDEDTSTKMNTGLIDALVEADEILITGEALSHCVANTITDVATQFGSDNIKKFVLLEDTTSNVPGFEKLGQDFVMGMVKQGMRVTKTTDY